MLILNIKAGYHFSWSNIPPAKRARVMFKMRNFLEDCADEVVNLNSSEHGKTHADALGEVVGAIRSCRVCQRITAQIYLHVAQQRQKPIVSPIDLIQLID